MAARIWVSLASFSLLVYAMNNESSAMVACSAARSPCSAIRSASAEMLFIKRSVCGGSNFMPFRPLRQIVPPAPTRWWHREPPAAICVERSDARIDLIDSTLQVPCGAGIGVLDHVIEHHVARQIERRIAGTRGQRSRAPDANYLSPRSGCDGRQSNPARAYSGQMPLCDSRATRFSCSRNCTACPTAMARTANQGSVSTSFQCGGITDMNESSSKYRSGCPAAISS